MGRRRTIPFFALRGFLLVLGSLVLAGPVRTALSGPADCPPPARVHVGFAPGDAPAPPATSRLDPVPAAGSASRSAGGPAELPVPSVSIRVRVPAESPPGKELTYRLLVENCSRTDAHHVTVKATLTGIGRIVRTDPEPVERSPALIWKLGTMKSCAKREIVVVVEPGADAEVSCCARVQLEHGQCVRTRLRPGKGGAPGKAGATPGPAVPDAEKMPFPRAEGEGPLQVRIVGPTAATLHGEITSRIEVRNLGREELKDVVIEDTLPEGIFLLRTEESKKSDVLAPEGENPLVWKLGTLSPGQVRSFTFYLASKKLGTMTSKVAARSGTHKSESSHTVRIGQPTLQVIKSGPSRQGVGRDTGYFITVINKGDFEATNVEVVDRIVDDKGKLPLFDKEGKPLPDADKLGKEPIITVERVSEGGRRDGGNVVWKLGTLPAGTRRTVWVVMRSRLEGKFDNVSLVQYDGGLKEQAVATTLFVPSNELTVEIERGADPVAVGQTASFTLRVLNKSALRENNVQVALTLPEGWKVTGARDSHGPVRVTTTGTAVRLPELPSVNPGEEKSLVVEMRMERAGKAKMEVELKSGRLTADRKPFEVRFEESWTVLPK